jgi:hypothetical protein
MLTEVSSAKQAVKSLEVGLEGWKENGAYADGDIRNRGDRKLVRNGTESAGGSRQAEAGDRRR